MRIANKLPLLLATCLVIWLIAGNGYYLYATLFDDKSCSEIKSQLKSNDGILQVDSINEDKQESNHTEVNSHPVLAISDTGNSQKFAGSTYPAILIVIVLLQIILIIFFIKSNRRREKSESELRRSREMFTQVFNRSPAYKMIVEGESGKIVNANNKFIELAGVDVIGKTIYEVTSPVSKTTFASIISGEHILSATSDEHELAFINNEIRTYIIKRVLLSVDGKTFMLLQMVDISEKVVYRRRLLEVDQLERKRIGQELHDGLGQQLTGILYLAEAVAMDIDKTSTPHYDDMQKIISLIRGTIDDVRRISRTYFPARMKTEGLIFCIEDFAEYIRSVFKVDVEVKLHDQELYVNIENAIQIYYITLEAVNNAVRHGKPSHIKIGDTCIGDSHCFFIKDNGTGIDGVTGKIGIGLEIMRYRAALLQADITVNTNMPTGTAVSLHFKNMEKDE